MSHKNILALSKTLASLHKTIQQGSQPKPSAVNTKATIARGGITGIGNGLGGIKGISGMSGGGEP